MNLGKVVPVLMGRKYLYGGNGEKQGEPFDCFGLIIEYNKLRYSIDLLTRHKDYEHDLFNYTDFCEETLKELFHTYLLEKFLMVVPSYKIPGDLLWCEAEGKGTVGINLGNKNMLVTSPETDCVSVSTSYYEIKEAYRCPLLYR